MNETNWSTIKPIVTDNDIKTLAKAKRMEKEKKEKGYRWITLDKRTSIFVPCDENGEPTKQGKEMIRLAIEKPPIR